MADDYLPRDDSGAAVWMLRFARAVAAEPPRWHVDAAAAGAALALAEVFDGALREATQPDTRGPRATGAKRRARDAAERACRALAQQVKRDGRVSDGDRFNVGVRPVNSRRTRRRLSRAAVPVLWMLGPPAFGEPTHVVRFADEATLDCHAKPASAFALQLPPQRERRAGCHR